MVYELLKVARQGPLLGRKADKAHIKFRALGFARHEKDLHPPTSAAPQRVSNSIYSPQANAYGLPLTEF